MAVKIWIHFMGQKNEKIPSLSLSYRYWVAMVQKTLQMVPKKFIQTVGLWVHENMCIVGNMPRWHYHMNALAQKPQALSLRAHTSIDLPCVGSLPCAGCFLTPKRWICHCRRSWVSWRCLKACHTRFSKLEKRAKWVTAFKGENVCTDVGILCAVRQSPAVGWVALMCLAGARCHLCCCDNFLGLCVCVGGSVLELGIDLCASE